MVVVVVMMVEQWHLVPTKIYSHTHTTSYMIERARERRKLGRKRAGWPWNKFNYDLQDQRPYLNGL